LTETNLSRVWLPYRPHSMGHSIAGQPSIYSVREGRQAPLYGLPEGGGGKESEKMDGQMLWFHGATLCKNQQKLATPVLPPTVAMRVPAK
jgi:hypothetical protein